MKGLQLLALLVLIHTGCFAQYYYNDLVSIQQGAAQYKVLRNNKVKTFKVVSYDADDQPAEGFSLEQEISLDGKKITITEASISGKKSVTVNTYELGRLKKAVASGNRIENKTDYQYDDKGQLIKITLTTSDTSMKYTSVETHEWGYDEKGLPASMLRVKNKTDSTFVSFVRDEQGNIAEERWKRKGSAPEVYYYYYNAKNELTDIVRYNSKLKKLLPDFLFEYDHTGRLSQMTQVLLGNNNYYTWKYTYNEKGLKQKESCFDKSQKKAGSIEYLYSY
jgi:YD repeat-containing protein